MTTQLSATELQTAQTLLQNYTAAQPAIDRLTQNNGDLEASLGELVAAEAGAAMYGPQLDKLRTAFLKTLQQEICGDDSFRTKVEEYNKNSGKAALLTELIVHVLDVVALPMITPAIATIAVLWILKIGLRTFCDYTKPASN
ncbi:MAG: hypothetical protein AAFQ74_15320 [Cyanobacteria bacterium J06623_4]